MIQGNNRGKIKQPPAKEVIKYIINPSISDAELSAPSKIMSNATKLTF